MALCSAKLGPQRRYGDIRLVASGISMALQASLARLIPYLENRLHVEAENTTCGCWVVQNLNVFIYVLNLLSLRVMQKNV